MISGVLSFLPVVALLVGGVPPDLIAPGKPLESIRLACEAGQSSSRELTLPKGVAAWATVQLSGQGAEYRIVTSDGRPLVPVLRNGMYIDQNTLVEDFALPTKEAAGVRVELHAGLAAAAIRVAQERTPMPATPARIS